MEQHAVPRQITTFEFKLIGFLTLKQFGYLVFFSAISFILFYIIPIPFLNIVFAALAVVAGVVLVFVPYNDRPLDVWVRNFLRKLFTPSQYYFIKHNQIPDFLKDVFVYSAPDVVEKHVEAQQKLHSYLNTDDSQAIEDTKKQHIHELMSTSNLSSQVMQDTPTTEESLQPQLQTIVTSEVAPPNPTRTPLSSSAPPHPFLFGVVKNSKNIPIPQILIYVKDTSSNLVRILKTNHNGVFATYHPLPENNYFFEIKDLGQKYFFDTMELPVNKTNGAPIEFFSKEVL